MLFLESFDKKSTYSYILPGPISLQVLFDETSTASDIIGIAIMSGKFHLYDD